jgi:hypothetical protein
MKNITFIDYPQSIKDVLKNKVDNQLLQSLLTTTAIATSRLTRNDKLTGLDKNIIITPNKPIKEDIIIKRKPAVEPPLVEQPMPTPEIIVEPIPVLIDYAPRGGGGGFGGEIIDNSRLGGGMGREQLFNNDGLNEQRENLR